MAHFLVPWWSDDDRPYLHRIDAARRTSTGYSSSINSMSEILPKYIERRGMSHFILTSFHAAISEISLHKKWLNAVVLHEYIHQRYCSNGLQFTLVAMMRCINKAYQNSSYNANYIEVCNGTKLDMYIQHQRRQGETKTSYYFYKLKLKQRCQLFLRQAIHQLGKQRLLSIGCSLQQPDNDLNLST